jgi:hypothetical protein
MSIIIPGWQVLVTSGDAFTGLTVGAYGTYPHCGAAGRLSEGAIRPAGV